jgi:hypothetical protein
MLDLFNIPTPQTANYQEFYGPRGSQDERTWVKPRGVSMIRFMLIGGGGNGGNGTSTDGRGGGGSAAVTSWIGPAMFVPDILNIRVASPGNPTFIQYRSSNGLNSLLAAANGTSASGTSGGSGGSAMTRNQFTACGIFISISGQNGAAGNATGSGTSQTASTTTFLSGGAGGAGGAAGTGGGVTPTYGYTALPTTTAGGTVAGANGYFITQPILVGCGGAGGTTSTSVGSAGGRGGIGCGGGGAGEDATTGGGRGGDGAVFIWAW